MSETNSQSPATPASVTTQGVGCGAGFGLCRDCKWWLFSRHDQLAEYPRDQHPSKGWLDGVCPHLHRNITITASGGWDGATVDSVETDANFGCVLFEPNK
jgi:hypothetical protein